MGLYLLTRPSVNTHPNLWHTPPGRSLPLMGYNPYSRCPKKWKDVYDISVKIKQLLITFTLVTASTTSWTNCQSCYASSYHLKVKPQVCVTGKLPTSLSCFPKSSHSCQKSPRWADRPFGALIPLLTSLCSAL